MLVSIFNDIYSVSWPRKSLKVYLRFGMFSSGEVSSNHHTGDVELGLSVYPANLENNIVKAQSIKDICPWVESQGRMAFVVTGREVGIGSDGEPVLRGVRMLPYAISINLMTQIRTGDLS